ncbi:hypothetical protein Nmel_005203 [Mimus melanotis]
MQQSSVFMKTEA